jgi:uncharacterized protein (TIGR03000 family)
MLKRCLWSAGVLAVATVLLLPQVSDAQRRGLFRRGANSYGTGGNYYGNYGMGSYGYGYGQPYQGAWGNGWVVPGQGMNGYGAPMMYNQPSVFNGSTQSYQSFYPPNMALQTSPNEARLMVLVPDPNAQVYVDGHQTQQRGTQREFVSEMSPGSSGTYHVKVRWNQDGRTREQTRDVRVRAGARQVLDFNQSQGSGSSAQGVNPRTHDDPDRQ